MAGVRADGAGVSAKERVAVGPLLPEDRDAVARVMGEAFASDPAMQGVVAADGDGAAALAADHPLLPVTVGPRAVTVGPWCAPGVRGCPLCRWPVDPAGVPGAPTAPGPSAHRGQVDGLAALRAAVLTVDALRTGPAPGVLRADRVTGRTRRVKVRPRPGCACDPDALGWAF